MKSTYLVLRVSRRALAAVSLQADDLRFFDGRHLPSDRSRALRATRAYVEKLLIQVRPDTCVVDAPLKEGSLTMALLAEVQRVLAEQGIRVEHLSLPDVLSSFGLPGIRTRAALQHLVEGFWPPVAQMTNRVKPYVLEAAAVAEYVDAQAQLDATPG